MNSTPFSRSAINKETLNLPELILSAVQETDADVQMVALPANHDLFSQGDAGDFAYVLVSGALSVRVYDSNGTESVIDKLTPGAVVGELSLLSGQPRTATVTAVSDATLVRLSPKKYEQLTAVSPQASAAVQSVIEARWQRLQLNKVLTNLLGDLDANALHALQEQLIWRHLSNGDVLFREGGASDGMYVVINGRLRFTTPQPDTQTEIITEIGPGETVGEYALLTDEVRSATVYAIRETNVVQLTPPIFAQMVQTYPQIMQKIAHHIITRQRHAQQEAGKSIPERLSIAVVAAQSGIALTQFATSLEKALSKLGPTLTLDSTRFDEKYGQAGISQTPIDDPIYPALVAWIGELETAYRYLLFTVDDEITPWTKRCINQADRVIVLANPADDPTLGKMEQMLSQLEIPIRTELVLWHPPETKQPQGTLAWLEKRQVHAYHHVRQGDAAHMGRLARRLAGYAIAVVLSGGAARGFAHLGVLRALEELDIPIDYIGGTSMGSVIAGGYLLNPTYEQMRKVIPNFASPEKLFDRTLPLVSIMASKKVTQFTQAMYGDVRIEDLWRPFFCVASNLTTAEPVVYTQGPLWRAIRASLAIPGIFAPVVEDGDVIVDGGVMDNFPARRMAQFCESERLIGVQVSPHKIKKRSYNFDLSISGWRVLFSRLNPFKKSLYVPSIIGTLLRTLEVNSMHRIRHDEAVVDVMVYPDVKHFDMSAYDRFAEIAQKGYEASLERLRTWKAKRLLADPPGSFSN